MSRKQRRHRSTARMVAWYLTAIAVISVAAVADELLRHELVAVLAIAGPAAGYALGRVHGARRNARTRGARASLRPSQQPGTREQSLEEPEWPETHSVTRARLLTDPRSGARPLGGAATHLGITNDHGQQP